MTLTTRTPKRVITGLLAFAFVGAMSLVASAPALAVVNNDQGGGGQVQHTPVEICHWDNGHGGEWGQITVDDDSIVSDHGHGTHQDGRDIIPPFDYYGGHFDGLNWDTEHIAIYNNDCATPPPPTLKDALASVEPGNAATCDLASTVTFSILNAIWSDVVNVGGNNWTRTANAVANHQFADGSTSVTVPYTITPKLPADSDACYTPPPPVVECAYTGSSITQSNRATDLSSTTVTLKEGFSFCDVSLNNYHTSGPTWATGNPQTFGDHDTVHLTADNPTGDLSVTQGPCYNQNDLYFGTTRFDGTDGALPHYPDSVTPTHLIDHWNGGSACAPPTIPVELCNRTDGYLNPDEGGLMPEQTLGGLLLDGPSLIHFPISGYTLANLPNPTMVVEVSVGSTPFMKVETTAPYSTLNYFGGGLWGTTKIAYSSPGGMGNPIPAADLVGKWNYTSSTVPYSFGVGYANDTGNTAVVKSLSFGGTTYDFVCVTKVVPIVPVVNDSCGTVNDHYGLPADTEEIAYTLDGHDIIATLKGDQFGFGTLPSGYVDNHDGTATYAFSNTDWSTAPCITLAVPDVPNANDSCGTSNDQFDLPTTEGIVYTRDGHDIVATPADATHALGTLPSGWADNGNGSATYAFLNFEWSSAPCPIEDTPGTGTFNDTCGVDHDTYTVPVLPKGANWHYEVNGKTVTAGTYPATGTVTVVAVPNDEYSFPDGVQTSWSHDFTNRACPPTLAFTGINPIIPLGIAGLMLASGWAAIWWQRRKTIVTSPNA